MADPRDASSRRATGLLLCAFAGLVVLLWIHRLEWRFTCDDAYISFRYAKNFAQSGELAFNLNPVERVEGYTNPLWVVVLALGALAGVDPPTFAPALDFVASATALVLVVLIVRGLRVQFSPRAALRTQGVEIADLLPALWLAALPEFVVWSSGGLEGSFALALGLGAVWAWLSGRIPLAAGLAALAGLTRLDSLAWIAAFGVAWLVARAWQLRERDDRPEVPWTKVGIGAAVFVLLLGGHLLWRKSYYGAWLPHTWEVKQHGALLRDTFGVAYVETWAESLSLLYFVPLVAWVRVRHLLVLLPLGVAVLYAWSVGGDFMAYSRLLLPATTFVAIALGWLLMDAGAWLAARTDARIPTVVLAWALIVAWTVWQAPGRVEADRRKAWLDGKWESVQAMDRFAKIRVAAGEKLAEAVPPDTVMTVGAAGAMPYSAGGQVYDVYGLVDVGVVDAVEPSGEKTRPGHQLYAPLDYMMEHDPDLVCHIGWAAIRPPTDRDRRKRVRGRWEWACVETGPMPDFRSEDGELKSRYYCCLRPKDRQVGAFGGEG